MKKNITNNPTIVIRDDGFSHLFRCEMPCTPKKFGDLFAGYLKGKAHIREIGVGAGFAYTYNTKIGDIMGSDVPIKFIDDSHDGQLSWNLPKEILDLLKQVGCVNDSISQITIQVLAYQNANYTKHVDCSDVILDAPMTSFYETLPIDGVVTLILE
mgnify:CR=1 FL=1